jgi:hypothetical protein
LKGLLSSSDEKRHVTKMDCTGWLAEGLPGHEKLAAFIRQRFRERYINPVLCLASSEKNGFSIMAVSCLLIEAYETFRQGWPSSDRKSALAFRYFFDREDRFSAFKGHSKQFYEHVRCGILHQGESTGGWQITRGTGRSLFDASSLTVHATKFHDLLAEVIDSYSDSLKTVAEASETWKNFHKKMKATLDNCER